MAINYEEEYQNFLPASDVNNPAVNFNVNLATLIDEGQKAIIATDLIEGIKKDRDSRDKWEQGYKSAMDYLGIEQKFDSQTKTVNYQIYDSTLLNCVLKFVATAQSELYPPKGVADFEIITPDGTDNEIIKRYGEQQKNLINNYLKLGDKSFYKNSQAMLMPLALNGCVFKKVYNNPIANQPISRYIRPQDIIINNSCLDLLESERITHVLYLTKKDVVLNENSGFFIGSDNNLTSEQENDDQDNSEINAKTRRIDGISDDDDIDEKFIFKHYESHVSLDYPFLLDLEPNKPNFPIPYVVTICKQTQKVVAIYRNWLEGDASYTRDNCFVQFNYFSGFGLYGYGMLHLLGNDAQALTMLQRQLLTAGSMANYPAYFKAKGLKIEHPQVDLQPGQSIDVETGSLPINQAVMPLPFKGADPVLVDLKERLKADAEQTGSIADTKLAEINSNAPVGTTVALLETQQKFQSSVIRSCYNSLADELQMIYARLAQPSSDPQEIQLSESIRIIPAADPTFSTNLQRIMKADAMLRTAMNAPQLHNMREVFSRFYTTIGVENIEQVLPLEPNPVPLDPITENMNILNNKAVRAEMWQDHVSHITCHQVFAEQNKGQDFLPNILAHIREHLAFAYLIEMQQAMGIQLPPMEALQNPKVQNEVAMLAAQAAESQGVVMDSEKPPEITEVAMAEVVQKDKAAELKASVDLKKIEGDSYKAQLQHETEKMKIEAEKDMFEERMEIELKKMETQKEIAEEKNELERQRSEIIEREE